MIFRGASITCWSMVLFIIQFLSVVLRRFYKNLDRFAAHLAENRLFKVFGIKRMGYQFFEFQSSRGNQINCALMRIRVDDRTVDVQSIKGRGMVEPTFGTLNRRTVPPGPALSTA